MNSLHPVSKFIALSICFILLTHSNAPGGAVLSAASGSQTELLANPQSVVIKVGDEATINLTVSGGAASGLACFGEKGFPSSGFTLTFLPQCAIMKRSMAIAQLTVEATPAAAPQNFTAVILATVGNQTASAPLTVTVVPAIPAWIPWLGLVLFFLVIGAALFVKPRRTKGKRKMSGT